MGEPDYVVRLSPDIRLSVADARVLMNNNC